MVGSSLLQGSQWRSELKLPTTLTLACSIYRGEGSNPDLILSWGNSANKWGNNDAKVNRGHFSGAFLYVSGTETLIMHYPTRFSKQLQEVGNEG